MPPNMDHVRTALDTCINDDEPGVSTLTAPRARSERPEFLGLPAAAHQRTLRMCPARGMATAGIVLGWIGVGIAGLD